MLRQLQFLLSALLATHGMAQTATTMSSIATITPEVFPSATLLLPANISSGFAGALVHAADCWTTFRLACTDDAMCSSVTASITHNAFDYIAAVYSTSDDTTKFASASYSIINLNSAICDTYLSSAQGTTTVTNSVSTTLSGTQLQYAQIPITAGTSAMTIAAAASCAAGLASGVASPTAGPQSSSTESESDGLSTGAKVGLGVGIGIGVCLILGVIAGFFLYRRHSRKKAKRSAAAAAADEKKKDTHAPPPPAYAPSIHISPMSPQQTYQAELDSPSTGLQMGELPADVKRFEMGAVESTKGSKSGLTMYELPEH